MTKLVYILNGPNLNLLGKRQPHIYGSETLADVERDCTALAADLSVEIRFLQSNAEGQIIDWIHEAIDDGCGIIINPAAYSFTSIAILDALKMFPGPIIELHISNVHAREAFRRLHDAGTFVLPNPWDVPSARLLEHLGFPALATTSSGFAATLGRADQRVTRDELVGRALARFDRRDRNDDGRLEGTELHARVRRGMADRDARASR